MSVAHICSRDVDVVEPDASASDAARRMSEREVGTLVVLDRSGRPAAIVTDRDLAFRVMAAGRRPETTRVREIWSAPVRTIAEGASVDAAITLLRESACRQLPVVNAEGKVVGILRLDDVLATFGLDVARPRRRPSEAVPGGGPYSQS